MGDARKFKPMFLKSHILKSRRNCYNVCWRLHRGHRADLLPFHSESSVVVFLFLLSFSPFFYILVPFLMLFILMIPFFPNFHNSFVPKIKSPPPPGVYPVHAPVDILRQYCQQNKVKSWAYLILAIHLNIRRKEASDISTMDKSDNQ